MPLCGKLGLGSRGGIPGDTWDWETQKVILLVPLKIIFHQMFNNFK